MTQLEQIRPRAEPPAASRVGDGSRDGRRALTPPLTAEEIAAVRRPFWAASLLPGRAYHDPAVWDFAARAAGAAGAAISRSAASR